MSTIGKSPSSWKHVSSDDWRDWRWQLRHSVKGSEGLISLLAAEDKSLDISLLHALVDRYRFSVVPYYLSLIDWGEPDDPIRRQCMPDLRECSDQSDLSLDPFMECATPKLAGVVHRFPDRVLIMASRVCAMYCRHCTRKNTLETMPSAVPPFDEAVVYISDHPEVREVIVSGGDPLLLDIGRLDALLGRLQAIPHVEVVRIGTRIPVVLPMRVDDELVAVLQRHKPLWVNTQFNHPRELTEQAIEACRRLTDCGIPVSNQSVLLKGVNDRLDVMRKLCTELQRNVIRPYYVFQCDPIVGISHFRTELSVGAVLEQELRACVGGLCLPRFVADIPGESGKTPLETLCESNASFVKPSYRIS